MFCLQRSLIQHHVLLRRIERRGGIVDGVGYLTEAVLLQEADHLSVQGQVLAADELQILALAYGDALVHFPVWMDEWRDEWMNGGWMSG